MTETCVEFCDADVRAQDHGINAELVEKLREWLEWTKLNRTRKDMIE